MSAIIIVVVITITIICWPFAKVFAGVISFHLIQSSGPPREVDVEIIPILQTMTWRIPKVGLAAQGLIHVRSRARSQCCVNQSGAGVGVGLYKSHGFYYLFGITEQKTLSGSFSPCHPSFYRWNLGGP